MEQVDRRQFMQKAGIASAAAGAVWIAPSVLGSSSAFAAGSCINHASLIWSGQTGQTITPAGTNAPNTGGAVTFTAQIPASGTHPAIHVVMTVTPVAAPGTGTGGVNGGIDQGAPFNGSSSFYKLSMTDTVANQGYDMVFNFYSGTTGTTPVNVYNLSFTVLDIDRDSTATGFRDSVWFTPTAGAGDTFTHGTNITGNGTAASPWLGNDTGGDTDATVTGSGAYKGPLSTMTMSYRSAQFFGEHQTVAITDLSWCY